MDHKAKIQEVALKLRQILYAQRISKAEVTKLIGLDSKTIDRACEGDLTKATMARLHRLFATLDKRKVKMPSPPENQARHPWYHTKMTQDRRSLLFQIDKLHVDMWREFEQSSASGHFCVKQNDDWLRRHLVMMTLQAKRLLVKKYRTEPGGFELWDSWDYWQWKEKLQTTAADKS